MTATEARKIIHLLLQAHRGCEMCAGNLVREFVREWPGYVDIAEELWTLEFSGSIPWPYPVTSHG